MRQQLLALGATPIIRLPHYGYVTTAGVVIAKQRPPTAKGFAFYVLEDGSLRIQIVISPDLWQSERDTLREARILVVSGQLQKRGKAWTLRAESLVDAHRESEYVKIVSKPAKQRINLLAGTGGDRGEP